MRTRMLLVVACVATLSACATRMVGPSGVPFDPENPKVFVIAGKQIVVDQEPIFVTRKGATIVWELPKDQKLTFPSDGIVVRAERNEFACRVEEGATRFSCRWVDAKPHRSYKYTIKVRQDGKDLPPLDPSMFGDF
ncbi:MAG: hypothetical protein IT518_01415 [Burkholderiales bacterium]|nr:hypothetical protein [Burkholderiales bacterium]